PPLASRHRSVDPELALLAHDSPVVPLFFTRGDFAYRPDVYNGWVYVKGTGILDKQSFLSSRAVRPAVPAPSPDGAAAGQDSGANVLLVFGIGIACLLALAGAWRL